MINTEELREMIAGATALPWVHRPVSLRSELLRDEITAASGLVAVDIMRAEDTVLIVAAVNVLPALLDERDALIARVAELEAQKWDVRHTSMTNDLVQMGLDRDAAEAMLQRAVDVIKDLLPGKLSGESWGATGAVSISCTFEKITAARAFLATLPPRVEGDGL